MAEPRIAEDHRDGRAVGYIRVSTVEQSRHGHSEEIDQPREIDRICERDGLELVKTFVEKPQSAKTNERPEFQAMVEFCVRHGIKHIVARMWERLSRSDDPIEYGEFLGTLKRHQIQVHLSKDSLDVATASGDMLRALIEQWFAGEDNTKRSEKAYGAWRTRRGQGRYLAGRPPHGFDYVRKHRLPDGTLVPGQYTVNEAEAEAVRYVFRRFLDGAGSNIIARELVGHGWRRRNGAAFNPGDIRDFLDKPIYAGYVLDRGELFKANNVEPLISFSDWSEAQDVRASRRRHDGRIQGKSDYWWSGLCRCARCDAPMVRHTSTSRLKDGELRTYTYLRCRTAYLEGDEACSNAKFFPEGVLYDYLGPLLYALASEEARGRRRGMSTEAIQELGVRKRNLETQLANYARQQATGNIPLSVYEQVNAPVKKEYDEVVLALATAREQQDMRGVRVRDMTAVLHDREAMRLVLQRGISRIVVDGTKVVRLELSPNTNVQVSYAEDGHITHAGLGSNQDE